MGYGDVWLWWKVMFGSDERYSDSSNDRRKPIPRYKKHRGNVLKTPEQSIENTEVFDWICIR